nr:MAG TPA: hypothetical protein [Caudoviricetes sp.]
MYAPTRSAAGKRLSCSICSLLIRASQAPVPCLPAFPLCPEVVVLSVAGEEKVFPRQHSSYLRLSVLFVQPPFDHIQRQLLQLRQQRMICCISMELARLCHYANHALRRCVLRIVRPVQDAPYHRRPLRRSAHHGLAVYGFGDVRRRLCPRAHVPLRLFLPDDRLRHARHIGLRQLLGHRLILLNRLRRCAHHQRLGYHRRQHQQRRRCRKCSLSHSIHPASHANSAAAHMDAAIIRKPAPSAMVSRSTPPPMPSTSRKLTHASAPHAPFSVRRLRLLTAMYLISISVPPSERQLAVIFRYLFVWVSALRIDVCYLLQLLRVSEVQVGGVQLRLLAGLIVLVLPCARLQAASRHHHPPLAEELAQELRRASPCHTVDKVRGTLAIFPRLAVSLHRQREAAHRRAGVCPPQLRVSGQPPHDGRVIQHRSQPFSRWISSASKNQPPADIRPRRRGQPSPESSEALASRRYNKSRFDHSASVYPHSSTMCSAASFVSPIKSSSVVPIRMAFPTMTSL